LARREEYNKGNTKKWDISGDVWNDIYDFRNLRVAALSRYGQ